MHTNRADWRHTLQATDAESNCPDPWIPTTPQTDSRVELERLMVSFAKLRELRALDDLEIACSSSYLLSPLGNSKADRSAIFRKECVHLLVCERLGR
jgi:hypothetical protein